MTSDNSKRIFLVILCLSIELVITRSAAVSISGLSVDGRLSDVSSQAVSAGTILLDKVSAAGNGSLESLRTILHLATNGKATLGTIIFVKKRLLDLFLSIFDNLRWKYTWFKSEIQYAQCISNSILQVQFASRHLNVILKIIYEFLGFVQNVFGDSLNENAASVIVDQLSTATAVNSEDVTFDGNDVNEFLRVAADREVGALMRTSSFISCSKSYLTSVFVRILRLLYGT